jgi:hypothetical protein
MHLSPCAVECTGVQKDWWHKSSRQTEQEVEEQDETRRNHTASDTMQMTEPSGIEEDRRVSGF